jgi:hypothetical protein
MGFLWPFLHLDLCHRPLGLDLSAFDSHLNKGLEPPYCRSLCPTNDRDSGCELEPFSLELAAIAIGAIPHCVSSRHLGMAVPNPSEVRMSQPRREKGLFPKTLMADGGREPKGIGGVYFGTVRVGTTWPVSVHIGRQRPGLPLISR